jgi:arylsulfatase A
VPLLASRPGSLRAGVCADLVDVSDLLPTLAALAGAELPAGVTLDGRSFAPQLVGGPARPRDWVYSGHRGRSFLRDQRWKLTHSGELYDLDRDPDESAAIRAEIDTAESAAARERLVAYVRAYFPEQRLP